LVLLFRSGACLLVYTGPGQAAVDATLIGNHGAAYGAVRDWEAQGGVSTEPALADQMVRAIRESLTAERTVSLLGKPDTDARVASNG
jgi:hypothetical protein